MLGIRTGVPQDGRRRQNQGAMVALKFVKANAWKNKNRKSECYLFLMSDRITVSALLMLMMIFRLAAKFRLVLQIDNGDCNMAS